MIVLALPLKEVNFFEELTLVKLELSHPAVVISLLCRREEAFPLHAQAFHVQCRVPASYLQGASQGRRPLAGKLLNYESTCFCLTCCATRLAGNRQYQDSMEAHSQHAVGFEGARTKFYDFLDQYILPEADQAESSRLTAATANSIQVFPHYVSQLQQMRDAEKTTLYVQWEHLVDYDLDLAQFIEDHHHRVEPYLRKALQNLVRSHIEAYSVNEGDQSEKEFWVAFYNLANLDKLRNLKTEQIGKLRGFSGTVTRTSEVRPELFLASFRCLECNTVVRDVEQQFKWTTPVICTNETCGNRYNWAFLSAAS